MEKIKSSHVAQQRYISSILRGGMSGSSIGSAPISSGKYSREQHGIDLRHSRKDAGYSFEGKASISPHGVVRWYDMDGYGITRVAVHGMDSLCVVTRSEDLLHLIDQETKAKLFCDETKDAILHTFCNAVVYEVEALADKTQKPFGVVSNPPQVWLPHERGADYSEEMAIEFLQREMNSHATFTFIKSVKTAISALQHYFGKKFKADEIRVFVLKSNSGARIHDIAYELQICEERSIEDLLAVINKPHRGGS